ncbi:MAG TPA: hypothetical protein V6C81_26140 [Planktothrix sp.]|jgi:hypothetical protein
MLRSFCLGALAGFFLGSSKTGMMMRSRVDGFFSELLGDNQSELKLAKDTDELSDENESSRGNGRKLAEIGGRRGRGVAEHKVESKEAPKKRAPKKRNEEPAESEQKEDDGTAPGEGGKLPLDKAVEMAEKLNAKPTTPPDEEAPAV